MYVLTVVLLSLGAASSLQLGFLEGQRYTYNYQSEVITSIPHSSDEALGLRMNSQVHADFFKNTAMQITLENISFHQVTGNDQNPKQQEQTAIDDKILKTLELPFKVVFNGGRIKEISAHNQDPEWSVNIKRGLVNLFQIAPEMNLEEEKDKQILHQLESTVMGNCPVSYVISPDKNQPDKKDRSVKLSKLINYDQCKNRPELNRNIFYSKRCDDCQQAAESYSD
ncbi:vitellogenin-5-like [Porites lutea]|uniref:vitellogenin-5-like n=1 Tax=Porites lutea TaxID=51062 RepID=UPI003CC5A4BD